MKLFVGLLFCAISSAQNQFLQPLFETGDSGALRYHLRSIENQPEKQTDRSFAELFLFEALEREGRVHEASEVFHGQLARCEERREGSKTSNTKASSGELLVCAIIWAEASRRTPVFKTSSYAYWALSTIEANKASKEVNEDSLYAEARVLSILPPAGFQNLGRALLALRILRSRHSNISSLDYWTGRIYYAQGNLSQAEEHFANALKATPPDLRTLVFKKESGGKDRRRFGLVPQLFFGPTVGAGISLRAFDDAMQDRDRTGSISIMGATRQVFQVELAFCDTEWMAPIQLHFSSSAQWAREDFFGTGDASLASSLSILNSRVISAELGVAYDIADHTKVFLQGEGDQKSIHSSSGVPYPGGSFSGAFEAIEIGPAMGVEHDSRDSVAFPQNGLLWRIKGFWASPALGSNFDFARLELKLNKHWYLGSRHGLDFYSDLNAVTLGAPLLSYPRLSPEYAGFQANRFREKWTLGSTLRYRWRMWRALSPFAQVSGALLGADGARLFTGSPIFSAGLGAIFHLSSERGPIGVFEVGNVRGEWAVRASGNMSF